jgi:phospholipase C
VTRDNVTRRDLLKFGAAAVLADLAGCGGISVSSGPPVPLGACSKLSAIEHVVIFIQENRSFDHYFGAYKGVRGFSDSNLAFQQPDPANTTDPPVGTLLPFHLDANTINATCTHDITHDWVAQHKSWNNGAMNGFVTSRLPTNDATLTMGYYNRPDLPVLYSLADAFTICDNFFCSVMGPTDPNRLYTMAASIDPDGKNGGPLLQSLRFNRQSFFGKLTYTTMPEQLQARGITWKVYSPPDAQVSAALSDNLLLYFKNFQDKASPLYQNAFVPTFDQFLQDAATGNLPQVSWVLAPLVASDHPPAPTQFGELVLFGIVQALRANSAQWAKTALFVTYDENGGFFDHVPPVTPAPGTPGEFITAAVDPNITGNILGPIGLGFRVPTIIVSPFSRGGFVSSDLFDHTSILRFLETRFGAEVPNLSAWRRAAVGDMTSAFNFKAPDANFPDLPSPLSITPDAAIQCATMLVGNGTTYPFPNPQVALTQEAGSPKRPSGTC